jgi:ferredoxin
MQIPMLFIALAVITDGFMGPDVSPMNLAGGLVWVVWRGLLIVGLLVAGNFFCTACPFMLPRTLAKWLMPSGMNWPRILRGKWLAIGLLILFFTAYETCGLWDSPRLTAWIIVGYFAAALLVDGLFKGAAFCKYVCPVGQFNFVQSLASPLEVAVIDQAVCASCVTKDCIRGRNGIPGCELELYQPVKRGNMDCTFCLDCVHACPHGNVGILAGRPGRGLEDDSPRSGIGRFGQRPDIAALVIVLVFASLANAAGMVGPVLDWELELQRRLSLTSSLPLIVILYPFVLVVLPVVLVGSVAWLSRALAKVQLSTFRVAMRFSVSLIPLGFAMWISHYSFHLVTSYDSTWPAIQRFMADNGCSILGDSEWRCACCCQTWTGVTKMELLTLGLGLLLSLYIGYRIACNLVQEEWRILRAFAPWAALMVILFAAEVWIILQPMQMRGSIMIEG